MDKFRVLSDLHIDVNKKFPFETNKGKDDVFTVICGDTSGDPKLTIEWVNKNVRKGILISGNHLPYCNGIHYFNEYDNGDFSSVKLMSELRQELADAFPAANDVTYLDVETGVFMKEVDGILFIGSTMYTDMKISHEVWNKTGDMQKNMECSKYNMNDYVYGFTLRSYPCGSDNEPSFTRMSPADYAKWFTNAFNAIDKAISENERSKNPLPVVLITHHSLIKDFCSHSYYVNDATYLDRPRDFNWSSYASDYEHWLHSHHSIKCYCCGHIHSPYPDYRHFKIKRNDGSEILVVNNTRGYCRDYDDFSFNPDRFVNTKTWELEEIPKAKENKTLKDDELLKAFILLSSVFF